MVTKATPEAVIAPQQTEVVIESPEVEVAAEIREKAQIFIDRMVKQVREQTEAYVMRTSVELESGIGTAVPGYQYWNCLTIGPVQFGGPAPYLPNKIIAYSPTNPALMLGLVWVNPALGPGGSMPGSVVLGAHDYRVRFESINLTNVTNGPDGTFTGTFASPAPIVTPFLWWMTTIPDPGINPKLYEVNMTADITVGGQPFAAFSTWHYDLDEELAFLGRPIAGPHWQFERPARFLVYHL